MEPLSPNLFLSFEKKEKKTKKKKRKLPFLRNWLMAFYTGAAQLNLPRSPDVYAHQYFAMNAALPSIRPVDLLAWSTWRPNHRINSVCATHPAKDIHLRGQIDDPYPSSFFTAPSIHRWTIDDERPSTILLINRLASHCPT
jgi:hypothetical protein